MIDGKTVISIIPARGGSEGLPRKNILPLAGKPLIAWSIEIALGSQYIDRCIVSTDDKEIADIAEKYGAEIPFMRPKKFATAEATGNSVIKHAKASATVRQAGIIQKELPISVSNTLLICTHCSNPTKVKFKILADGNKARTCSDCKEVIE